MHLVDRKMKSIEVIGTLKILKKCIVGEHFYIRKLCTKWMHAAAHNPPKPIKILRC